MRHALALLTAACIIGISIPWIAAEQSLSVAPASMDEIMDVIRTEMQTNRRDVMVKNLKLTNEQAVKFWPVYDAYQKEQNAIMDAHLRGVQQFIENFESLDDAGALSLIKAHLDRDDKMTSLRRKALGDFQKSLGTKLAVRAIQIDRRLSLVYQTQLVAKIPLSH